MRSAFFILVLLVSVARAEPTITVPELEAQIEARVPKVAEFDVIRREAAKRGLRIWLFGGTAAAYAHYVRWDMLRAKGDGRYQTNATPGNENGRFDYDFTNIYRSTQDLDLVVDGDAKAAKEFQDYLARRFPFFVGAKSNWEIRPLREGIDNKMALLGDFDFDNQHTDSNSTGMIELTKPPSGERVVRDLRDWNAKEPNFPIDVAKGEIHYYHSPTHEKTSLAKEGKNPPIFSVIRYLTKAFQYELKPREEDLVVIRKIIADFDASAARKDPAIMRWMNKHGVKLYKHAVNLEYASDMLDKLGLKKKLASMGDPAEAQSIAWWMRKAVLASKPFGTSGKTAGELGITEVAHETNSFFAYESITRAHTGDPNVFYSRGNVPTEAAVHGDGFYTAIGKKGARGSGQTIRFTVDKDAREGTDFLYIREHNYVVFLNKRALKVIPESLNLDFLGFFEMLANGDQIAPDDQALLEKFKRKIAGQLSSGKVPQEHIDKVIAIVKGELGKLQTLNEVVLLEWFRTPLAYQHPELFEALVERMREAKWGGARGRFGRIAGNFIEGYAKNVPPGQLFEKLAQSPIRALFEELKALPPGTNLGEGTVWSHMGTPLFHGVNEAIGGILADELLSPTPSAEAMRFFDDFHAAEQRLRGDTRGRPSPDSAPWKPIVEMLRRAVTADPSFRDEAKETLRARDALSASERIGSLFAFGNPSEKLLDVFIDLFAQHTEGYRFPALEMLDALPRIKSPELRKKIAKLLTDRYYLAGDVDDHHLRSKDELTALTAAEISLRRKLGEETSRHRLIDMQLRSFLTPGTLDTRIRRIYYQLATKENRVAFLELARKILTDPETVKGLKAAQAAMRAAKYKVPDEETDALAMTTKLLERERAGGLLGRATFECVRAVRWIGSLLSP